MTAPIQITWLELDVPGLRLAARRAPSVAASQRMLALALILEGASRTDAARSLAWAGKARSPQAPAVA